ncbi:MAG: SLC13 family permease, partial [Fusobacteriota bacterium]
MEFIIGIGIFLFTYFLIITEKIPHSFSALIGGFAMIGVGILTEEEAFHAIELEVIFLLMGMMLVVHIMSETGVFEWVSIKVAQLVKGEAFLLMVLLMIVTAVFSAFLDNVTTILLIAPVTVVLAGQLEISSIPFLIAETMAANIGGTATLIGDPPNILIGHAAGIGFNEFLINLSPLVLINLVVLIFTFWIMFGKKMKVSRELKARIMELDPDRTLRDKKLLRNSLIIMGLIIIGFLTNPITGIGPAAVAFMGAIALMTISKQEPEEIFKTIEWKTLFFFIGLFILVQGIVKIGAIRIVADKALDLTNGNVKATSMLILWLSAVASAIVDNIPYTATLIPMIKDEMIPKLVSQNPDVAYSTIKYGLWWALSLGACLGGNG